MAWPVTQDPETVTRPYAITLKPRILRRIAAISGVQWHTTVRPLRQRRRVSAGGGARIRPGRPNTAATHGWPVSRPGEPAIPEDHRHGPTGALSCPVAGLSPRVMVTLPRAEMPVSGQHRACGGILSRRQAGSAELACGAHLDRLRETLLASTRSPPGWRPRRSHGVAAGTLLTWSATSRSNSAS